MKTTLSRVELLEGLKKVGNYIDSKTKIHVLSGVKFEVVENTLVLTGMNENAILETEIETITTESNGSTVLPFKLLTDFIKKSKAENVTIEQIDNSVTIQAANIDYKLVSESADVYPKTPNERYDNYITIDVIDYKRMINNTTFAVAKSESRPILTGVNVRSYENKMRFVGTDSHRLGLYDIPSILENIDITLEGKALEKSLKVLNKTTKELVMNIGKTYSLIKFDNVKLYIKNKEGNYPEIERLLPENYSTEATLNTKEVIESVEMLSTIAKEDRNNVVRMELNGKIEMNSNSPELGHMSAKLEGKKQGEDLKISFSSKYFTDALKALNEETTYIGFTGSMRPFIAKSQDEKALQLILPVRTF